MASAPGETPFVQPGDTVHKGQTIGLIEAGGYNPTLNLCIAICKALDKTLDQLFWEEN